MTEKVHSVLRAQSQLRLVPELGQNLRPNLKLCNYFSATPVSLSACNDLYHLLLTKSHTSLRITHAML